MEKQHSTLPAFLRNKILDTEQTLLVCFKTLNLHLQISRDKVQNWQEVKNKDKAPILAQEAGGSQEKFKGRGWKRKEEQIAQKSCEIMNIGGG